MEMLSSVSFFCMFRKLPEVLLTNTIILTVLPNIRDGILIHTGNWTTDAQQWNPSLDMPNSSGCIHAHPVDVETIYNLLVKQGVTVNDNTFSGKNYPYKPQGVGVIELID